MIVAILAGLGLVFYISNLATSDATPERPKPAVNGAHVSNQVEAWTAAQEFVKKSLKSPSTASFGGMFEQSARENVKELPNETYVVTMWVDSQNAFGATVRTHFVIKLRHTGGSNWTLIEPITSQPITSRQP